jgi:hypothetical protein
MRKIISYIEKILRAAAFTIFAMWNGIYAGRNRIQSPWPITCLSRTRSGLIS